MRVKKILTLVLILVAIVSFSGLFTVAIAQVSPQQNFPAPAAKFTKAVAFDVSAPLRNMPSVVTPSTLTSTLLQEIRPERGPDVKDQGYSGDGALQTTSGRQGAAPAIPAPLLTFEGVSNEDNFNLFGFRVAPPDPVGDVGPNHYVEMINLVFAVYDKQGNKLLGPVDTGTLWQNFSIPDCTDPSGDPVVLYDQLEDRWLLSQFTTRGPIYYNCVAISQTGDPTGAYFRYAFSTGVNFPDYPKYGLWRNMYIITTREFGPTTEYGIGVYGLERDKMLAGDPNARVVSFFLDSAVVPINLIGDGLLPADIDGRGMPANGAPAPLVGTQDDARPYGATFDALNIWEFSVKWQANPIASINLKTQLPVASFDSIFPCGLFAGQTSRDCLPQPGVAPTANNLLDILSYRQRPTFRLGYRNFRTYESLVTNQSVEAAPGVAAVRWYEVRRVAST